MKLWIGTGTFNAKCLQYWESTWPFILSKVRINGYFSPIIINIPFHDLQPHPPFCPKEVEILTTAEAFQYMFVCKYFLQIHLMEKIIATFLI